MQTVLFSSKNSTYFPTGPILGQRLGHITNNYLTNSFAFEDAKEASVRPMFKWMTGRLKEITDP